MKQAFLAIAIAVCPLAVSADEGQAAARAQGTDPVLPSIVKPGRPHGERDPHRALTPEQQIRIALQHKREGRPHEAFSTLDNALMLHPDNAQLYAVRGSLYLEQGRLTEALADLEAAVRLDPDDAAVLTNRAQVYRGFGRGEEALADLDRAVALAPDLLAARFNRGAMWLEQGQLEGALEDFDYCIAVDPHAPGPYFNRAAVFDALGRREAAVTDIQRFLELTDNEAWKQSARDILKAWEDRDRLAAEAKDS